MGQAGFLPWVPLVPTPAGCRGPSPGTWASGPRPSAPDPNLSGEPGVLTPGPPHLGLLEGHPGQCGQALGVGPQGLRRLTMASLEGPKRPSVPEQSWKVGSGTRQGQGRASKGAVPGLRWVFFAQGVAGVSLVGPSCCFPARLPQPDGSNPVPFFLLPLYFGPGGGRQRWRVEFHFFPLFSLLQETASDDAGG